MEQKKNNGWIVWAVSLIYFISYLTRKTYPSVMSEMIRVEGIEKTAAALPVTVNFITYAIGQIFSGILSDRFKPARIILIGLVLTVLMNLFVPFTVHFALLTTILWAINGVAQAMMWPPIIKIMLTELTMGQYSKGCVLVSMAGNFGAMVVYLISSVSVRFSWKASFLISAFFATCVTVLWVFLSKKIGKNGSKVIEKKSENISASFRMPYVILGCIMLGIVLQGFLRDGLEAWMPTFLSENFGMNGSSSILSAVILPLFSVATVYCVGFVTRKWIKNECLCSMTFFLFSGIATLGMVLVKWAPVGVLSIALASALIHGVNYCFTCLVPAHFARSKHAALISGTLNCCTYGGSSLATIGVAVLSEKAHLGWDQIGFIFFGIAALGAVMCLFLIRPWQKFKNEQ